MSCTASSRATGWMGLPLGQCGHRADMAAHMSGGRCLCCLATWSLADQQHTFSGVLQDMHSLWAPCLSGSHSMSLHADSITHVHIHTGTHCAACTVDHDLGGAHQL